MSTETEQAKANAKSSHPRGGPADHDLDHSPAAAHKTSKAGLNKAAAAQQADSELSGTEQRNARLATSDHSSVAAFESAAQFAAKEMWSYATQFQAAMDTPRNEAGWEPMRAIVESAAANVTLHIEDLKANLELAKAASAPMVALQHSFAVFDRAFSYFDTTLDRIRGKFAHDGGGKIAGLSTSVRENCNSLYAMVGKPPVGEGAARVDGKELAGLASGQDKTHRMMIDNNFTAVIDAARLARTTIRSGDVDDSRKDLLRAEAHLKQLAAVFAALDARTAHTHAKQVAAVRDEWAHLTAEMPSTLSAPLAREPLSQLSQTLLKKDK